MPPTTEAVQAQNTEPTPVAQPNLHHLGPEGESKRRRLLKEPAHSPQRLCMAARGKDRNQLLGVGLYQWCEYSGHKFCYINESQRSHNLPLHLPFLLTAPLGDLISVKRWRSLSNGHVLLLSLSHRFLTPKGHGGIISYFGDQSPVLMTRSCRSCRAACCCSPATSPGCLQQQH